MHQKHWERVAELQYRELCRWRSLGKALIENNPLDDAADGVICLDVWRKEASELLKD